ncbi:MAG: ribosomal RNA small subunit methyltransferase A [Thermoplasmata archaeon]|nr:ribosomal RNA small subunit methyltransferase A [Thermoplasmata archaeon]
MIDENIACRQVALAHIEKGDRVLEVGGGHGMLTGLLKEAGASLTCIEKDAVLAKELTTRFPEVRTIHEDALQVEWPPSDVFVSNIPYVISSQISLRILKQGFKRAVVMYQDEFARRITAGPGSKTYSRLGVKMQYKNRCHIAFTVPRAAFSPPPNVDSAVVVIEPTSPTIEAVDEKAFFKLVDVLFSHRRKKARNNIIGARHLFTTKERADELEAIVRDWPLGDKRVESISIQDMVELSNRLSSSCSKI